MSDVMQCVILAGGLGTRIRSVSGDLPKSLIPVQGKPFIHYQLQWLQRSGIRDVLLCIGYRGGLIHEHVGDGSAWNLRVRYLDEKDELRGTGGALRWAADENLLNDLFFVMYGDSFLPIEFQAIWAAFQARSEAALMTVMRNQGQWDSSNASFDGSRVHYDKKKSGAQAMDFIDYGASLLRRDSIMGEIPTGVRYDLADYFERLSARNALAGYEIRERFYEIGSPQGLADFQAYAAKNLAS